MKYSFPFYFMNLSRTQIIKEGYKYPTGLIRLKPTKHFLSRLYERNVGISCVPTLVRVTEDNIHSGKTQDGITLSSVVIRLKYKIDTYVYLCFNPFDAGAKSIWFEKIRTWKSTKK